MGLPQYWLTDEVRAGMERLAATARQRDVSIAIHTHVNAAQSVTPLVARAAKAMLDTGIRDVRNQGVLLRGTNDSARALLDLCFVLLDDAKITPYYFYLCDMIPNSEHWRLTLAEAQELQHQIMGYLPGFATPRLLCDVPYVGKRWVHQVARYDTERGISYYDPIYMLPADGQQWWRSQVSEPERVSPERVSPVLA
jgi:lysine 2,3-aminomutase